jgi:hypothetical protein
VHGDNPIERRPRRMDGRRRHGADDGEMRRDAERHAAGTSLAARAGFEKHCQHDASGVV